MSQDRQASALALLAQKERQIQEKLAEMRQMEESLKQRQEAFEKLKRDLDGKPQDPMEPIHRQLSDLGRTLEEQRRFQEDYFRRQAQENYRKEVLSRLQGSEEFPLIRELGMYDSVLEHIQNHYNSTGQELREVDAAKQVEAQLSELVESIVKSEAVQTRFIAPSAASKPSESQPASTNLTDSIASEASSASIPNTGIYGSDEQSIQAAAQLLKFTTPE